MCYPRWGGKDIFVAEKQSLLEGMVIRMFIFVLSILPHLSHTSSLIPHPSSLTLPLSQLISHHFYLTLPHSTLLPYPSTLLLPHTSLAPHLSPLLLHPTLRTPPPFSLILHSSLTPHLSTLTPPSPSPLVPHPSFQK